MSEAQRDALDHARDAIRAKDYKKALVNYEYFFDHALDDDPAALYGVRLSFCLAEWARLGEEFPEATTRLEKKRDVTLDELYTTSDPEKFHDYIAICKYLECKELPIREFIRIHDSDRALAKTIVRFIWDELVDQEQWGVCIAYLEDYEERYKSRLLKFDQAISLCKSDATLGGDEFEEQIKGWYVTDVSNIILVLKNSDKQEKANEIRARALKDLSERNYTQLIGQIDERVAL